jgi:hypothetical protein
MMGGSDHPALAELAVAVKERLVRALSTLA